MDRIEIIEGAGDEAIAAWLTGRLRAALARAAAVAIAVPGGSTPFPILTVLAQALIEWNRVSVWLGDDRLVPENHPASNTGRIRAKLGSLSA